jgi:hypothetical protein
VATRRIIEPSQDKYWGCGPIVRGGIQSIPVDGDHDSIFEDPGVRPMAERANAVLLAAQAEARAGGAHGGKVTWAYTTPAENANCWRAVQWAKLPGESRAIG